MSFEDKIKARQLSDYFQLHGRIYIVVDATADAVSVPAYLKGDPTLRLAFNTRMPQAIHIQEDGVSSTLSFSGQPYDCHIPLQYIWAAYQPDGDLEDGLIWEDAVPEVIRSAIVHTLGESELTEEPLDISADAAQGKGAAKQDTATKVPYLRVVK